MDEMITVTIDGNEKKYRKGITCEKIASEYQTKNDNMIVLAVEDGKIKELGKPINKDVTIHFIDLKNKVGHRAYVRTATFLLIKAFYDVVGSEKIDKIKVEFAIGNGYYCTGHGDFEITEEVLGKVKEKMLHFVNQSYPIEKLQYTIEEAVRLFNKHRMKDKEKLFKFRRSSYINVYHMDGYWDYYYGHMLPNASYIKTFDLIPYESGFILNLPDTEDPNILKEFIPREKLFETLNQAEEWGAKLGVDTVGDLNNEICNGNLNEMVLVQEALQERRIGEIAKDIVTRGGVKFVMVAGPSSSGKTTFSHRLSVQLRTHGIKTHPIALDDYFVNREMTPKDENGDYNFECLEAIDIEQFNKDMCRLLAGETVEFPRFNFKTGMREYRGDTLTLCEDDMLVIEGIHGLNDKTSYALPDESKYRIYISALTSLNVDYHNRIPTTDGRLLRRMVRDARTRGASAKRTIEMWPSVRKGEEENIFPFQESADAMFNSALIYELAVLKQYAEPLLFSVEPGEPEYFEAKRLLKFFEYFLGVSTESIPNNSIIREFIGGSCFNV